MRMRRLPPTPERLREERNRPPIDGVRLRSYESNVGKRYTVEVYNGTRLLSDRDFDAYTDARLFAEMECNWNGAKLQDLAARG